MIPATPKLAATILVCRPSPLRVLMVKRSAKARFFPNYFVFPGGIFETADSSPDWKSIVGSPQTNDVETGRIVALRELFEETNFIVTKPQITLSAKERNDWRERIQKEPSEFLTFCRSNSCSLPLEKVYPYERWITPPQEKYRYDTYFYLTVVNDESKDLDIEHDGSETTSAQWISPSDALVLFDEQKMALAPPTWLILHDLASVGLDEHVKRCQIGKDMTPIEPQLQGIKDGLILTYQGKKLIATTAAGKRNFRFLNEEEAKL